MMSERYIFTKTELRTLLIGYGSQRVVGLDFSGAEPDDGEYLNALNSLSKRGLIECDGNSFRGSDDLRRIAGRLAGSDRFLAIHSRDHSLPDLCCFPDDEVMVCAEQRSDKSRVSLRFSSAEELIADLADEGYLPAASDVFGLDSEVLEAFESEVFSQLAPACPLDESAPVLFSAELIGADGSLIKSLRLTEYYYMDYIFFSDGKKTERAAYTAAALFEYLKGLLQRQ